MVHHWVRGKLLQGTRASPNSLPIPLHGRTSRGIGLEMTRQLLRTPTNRVIAACRNPSNALALRTISGVAKGKLHIIALDVLDRESIRKCAEEVAHIVGDKGIDYLVNNAGVVSLVSPNRRGTVGQLTVSPCPRLQCSGGPDTTYDMDMDALQQTFLTNVAGPAYITQCLIPLVENSHRKVVLNMSSGLGSNAFKTPPGVEHLFASYSISKAAMNMLVRRGLRNHQHTCHSLTGTLSRNGADDQAGKG